MLLLGAANTQKTDGSNNSSGGNIGVSLGVGSSGGGLSIFANANKSQGKEHGDGTFWSETQVDTGGTLSLHSGRDTSLIGAQASGESVKADVGRDLLLQSQQDSDNYDSKQTSISGGISVAVIGGGGSANLSMSKDKLHSNYDSVQEQTGIFAGKGGFDVKVGEHTQLDGAVIASTADKSKNSLDTGTLGFSNIENKADFKAEHQGGSLSTGGPVGSDLLSNLGSVVLSGLGNDGHADGTTQSAVSDGTITIRDTDKQQQNVDDLSRDTDNANGSIGPIFDKEKEQNRLKEAQLIGEIGGQVSDIVRTQGKIAEEKALKDPEAIQAAKETLAKKGILTPTEEQLTNQIRSTAMAPYGTGSALQQGIQAATAAIQGLAGGNMAQALAGASAPYLAEVIKKSTGDNQAANAMAHAVLGAVTAYASGNSALAGAAGAATAELMAPTIIAAMGWDKDNLSEDQKQTVSALATLAAGLAGGLTGDSTADTVAGAQTGKNAVENNFLSGLEGFGQGMISAGQATSTLGQFMEQNGATTAEIAQAQSDLAKGLGTGAPQPASELVKTWALLMSTAATMGTGTATGAGAMVTGGVISGTANVSTQLTVNGDKPFSYTDALIAIGAGALTQGKGPVLTGAISVGGAYVGSTIKGEDPTNAMIGAGVGSVAGSGTSKVVTDKLNPIISGPGAEVTGAVVGSLTSEALGSEVSSQLDSNGGKK